MPPAHGRKFMPCALPLFLTLSLSLAAQAVSLAPPATDPSLLKLRTCIILREPAQGDPPHTDPLLAEVLENYRRLCSAHEGGNLAGGEVHRAARLCLNAHHNAELAGEPSHTRSGTPTSASPRLAEELRSLQSIWKPLGSQPSYPIADRPGAATTTTTTTTSSSRAPSPAPANPVSEGVGSGKDLPSQVEEVEVEVERRQVEEAEEKRQCRASGEMYERQIEALKEELVTCWAKENRWRSMANEHSGGGSQRGRKVVDIAEKAARDVFEDLAWLLNRTHSKSDPAAKLEEDGLDPLEAARVTRLCLFGVGVLAGILLIAALFVTTALCRGAHVASLRGGRVALTDDLPKGFPIAYVAACESDLMTLRDDRFGHWLVYGVIPALFWSVGFVAVYYYRQDLLATLSDISSEWTGGSHFVGRMMTYFNYGGVVKKSSDATTQLAIDVMLVAGALLGVGYLGRHVGNPMNLTGLPVLLCNPFERQRLGMLQRELHIIQRLHQRYLRSEDTGCLQEHLLHRTEHVRASNPRNNSWLVTEQ